MKYALHFGLKRGGGYGPTGNQGKPGGGWTYLGEPFFQ